MKSNKLDLIKKASNSAPHKRKVAVVNTPKVTAVPAKRIRDNQSFYVGDTIDIVSRIKKGDLSKAIQKALRIALDKGELKEFLEDE